MEFSSRQTPSNYRLATHMTKTIRKNTIKVLIYWVAAFRGGKRSRARWSKRRAVSYLVAPRQESSCGCRAWSDPR